MTGQHLLVVLGCVVLGGLVRFWWEWRRFTSWQRHTAQGLALVNDRCGRCGGPVHVGVEDCPDWQEVA